jgi:enamidase
MRKVSDSTVKEKKRQGSSFWRFFMRFVMHSFLFAVIVVIGRVIYYYSTLYTVGEKQEGYLALTNATVLTGEELEAYEKSTVLIQDG